jgi:hypothetical protein
MDHLGRWLAVQTYLYPASGVQRTHVTVWRWTWIRERELPRTY